MKNLLLIFVLCALPAAAQIEVGTLSPSSAGGAANTVSVVGTPVVGGNGFGGATYTLAWTGGTVGGSTHTYCFVVQWNVNSGGTAVTLSSVTDAKSNTWAVVAGSLGNLANPSVDYAQIAVQVACTTGTTTALAGTDTVVAHFAGGTGASADFGTLVELAGTSTAPVVDGNAGATGTSAAPNAGNLVATTANQVGIAGVIQDDGIGAGGVFTAGTGWTIRANNAGGNSEIGSETRAIATASTQTGNFTSSQNKPWAAGGVTLK